MGFLSKLFGGAARDKKINSILERGGIIVDVRSTSEFSSGHIEGSINIPLPELSGKISKLKKKNKPIVVCCASGMRSGRAKSLLEKNGIECENGGSWKAL